MTNKLKFLTKMSLNKKIKTKWFLIANIIFAVLIIGLINVDSVIKLFGGDFDETQEILVIDEAHVFESFDLYFRESSKYLSDYIDTDVTIFNDSYDNGVKLVEEEDKILLVINKDESNYISAKLVSNDALGNVTSTLINATLSAIRSGLVLSEYNISEEMYNDINKNVVVENIVLSEEKIEDNMAAVSIMQIITMPLFSRSNSL